MLLGENLHPRLAPLSWLATGARASQMGDNVPPPCLRVPPPLLRPQFRKLLYPRLTHRSIRCLRTRHVAAAFPSQSFSSLSLRIHSRNRVYVQGRIVGWGVDHGRRKGSASTAAEGSMGLSSGTICKVAMALIIPALCA